MSELMRVGFYQFAPKPRALEENLNRIFARLKGVNADLIVLPELCLSGYLFASREELARYALKLPDAPVCSRLANFCAEKNFSLVLGAAEKAGASIFNSALLFTPNGSIHVYRKVHLFNDEKDIFDPGDLPFPVFRVDTVTVGMLVCFDYFFPESARSLVLRGAQIVCHPANLVLNYAQSMTITRAQENRVFWILANRTGTEALGSRVMNFTGQSQIISPEGTVLARASAEDEKLEIVDINPALALNKTVTPRNDLIADRRPGLYFSGAG
ncbi:MAG: acyltransferase [candidate division WOR-3 bacterium]|nr:acyltransferase [candidate division WOR-3 bacterium]